MFTLRSIGYAWYNKFPIALSNVSYVDYTRASVDEQAKAEVAVLSANR